MKTVRPLPAFYELLTDQQVKAIASSLRDRRELPRQFGYVGEGAAIWDTYIRRLWRDGDANYSVVTAELLRTALPALETHLAGARTVHIADLGVGNGLPLLDVIGHFRTLGADVRYQGFDISPAMLRLVSATLRERFDSRVSVDVRAADFSLPEFASVLRSALPQRSPCLVFVLGGTLGNLPSPEDALSVIAEGLAPGHLLVMSTKLDSPESRRYFDFGAASDDLAASADQDSYLPRLLGFDLDDLAFRHSFDPSARMRSTHVGLRTSLRLVLPDEEIVLKEGEEILLWRAWHHSPTQIEALLAACGFTDVRQSVTDDGLYSLALATRI